MNRKIFISLLIMMVLCIVGITWVQITWIRNAVGIRNENFNNAVFTSLNNAAGEIESQRKMNFFNDLVFQVPDTVMNTSDEVAGYVSIGSYISHDGSGFSININNQAISGKTDKAELIEIDKPDVTGKTTFESDSIAMIVTSREKPGKIRIVREGETIRAGSGSYFIKQDEYLNWVRKRSNEFRDLSERMISEIFEWEKTMNLDINEIKNTLNRFFSYYGIQTPYEFAVIKDGEIGEGLFEKSVKNDFLKSLYKVSLFPDNILRQDVILSVVFPGRTNYVLGSMAWILGGSMLFSLFIFATFALSIFFIIRQKKISEMKSDFINNMTHEFKTPIATISLAADTITNSRVINDEKRIRHFIGMIKKENNRMNKQVETILQIASLDKKEIEFKFENISLHAIIERAVETIEIQVQQKQGAIKVDLSAAEDTVYGDSEHLTNLVHNLLDNAIKYSSDAPEIIVKTVNETKGTILSVEDKGIGMTKSIQSKIFERFYRQNSGNIHDVKGFGLGLSYVRAIVDAHKGSITVHSEPGKGSKFEIYLPF